MYYIGFWFSLFLVYLDNEGIGHILVEDFYPTAPSRLFGYGCQPKFLASMVYFTFTFDIYNVQKHYTKRYILLLPYIFFDIFFYHHVHGLVFNLILLFYLPLGTLTCRMPSSVYSLLSEVLDHQVAAYVKGDFLSNFLYILIIFK